jgi:hypothetical protein
MRPRLKPALRRVWRDATTLQLGLNPAHATVIAGVDAITAQWLDGLDGTRDRAGVLRRATDLGIDEAVAASLLDQLTERGAIDSGGADVVPLRSLPESELDRLAPDLASLSLLHPRRDGGAVLASRRRQVVEIHGAGRVGASVALLCAAAGIGHLVVKDPETTRLDDAAPSGLGIDARGRRRDDATRAAARRVSSAVRMEAQAREVDLAIVTPLGSVDQDLHERFMRDGVPHLIARVQETTGVVGPLVVPGRSSCLRCHDLHRCDRDPAWPRLAAQLATDPGRQSRGAPAPIAAACDVTLAAAVAAHAVMQALAFLDGHPAPTTLDGTIEVLLPDGWMRRRSWTPHPGCGCGWGAAS